MTLFQGVFTAIVTPFKSSGDIDWEGLERNLEFLAEGGVTGVVPCGTTGESATLTFQEHKDVIDFVVGHSHVKVLAGTGSNNTVEAVELTRYAEDAGAEGVLVITPYYNKPNDAGMIQHYLKLADAVDIPIVLYNVPSRTSINLKPEVVAELASRDNIVGVKEASGNLGQVSRIIELTMDKDFSVLSGDDALTLPIISLGGQGVISVAANIVPDRMVEMVDSALRGRFEEARKIHYSLLPLFRALFLETNPIPVKKALELMGFDGGRLRLPLAGLSGENEKVLRECLEELGLL